MPSAVNVITAARRGARWRITSPRIAPCARKRKLASAQFSTYIASMRTDSEPAQPCLYVRLASKADIDKLDQERADGGFHSVAEMIRATHGLTPMATKGRPIRSPKRVTRK